MAKIIQFVDHRKSPEDGSYRFPAAGISWPVGHGAPAGSAFDGYDILIVRMYLHALATTDGILAVLMRRQSADELERQHSDAGLVERIRVMQRWINSQSEARVPVDGRVNVPSSAVYGWPRAANGHPRPWTIEVIVREWRRSTLEEGLRPLLSAHRDCPKLLRAWLRRHGL